MLAYHYKGDFCWTR